jgi:hypothetical protein
MALNDHTDSRKQRLDAIGFIWDPLDFSWEQGFRALEEFKKSYGNCLVPSRYKSSEGIELGNWVKAQRQNENGLSETRKKKLKSIGFIWNVFDYSWLQGISALKEYKESHGDCLVSEGYVSGDGYKLGQFLKNFHSTSYRLSDERKQMLSAVGYLFDFKDRHWELGFKALLVYREMHGHCKVPHDYVADDGFTLGTWVNTQKKTGYKLPEEKKQRLVDVGFYAKAKTKDKQ